MLEGANIKLSGTVSDINCMSARNILEYLLTGEFFDEAKYDEMYKQKIIAHNLKASKEQLIDDLNGVMTPLQRRMMKELLSHLDELNVHINNLEDEIDNFMKPEEKKSDTSNPGCNWYRKKQFPGHYFGDWYRHESFSNSRSSCCMGRTMSRQ